MKQLPIHIFFSYTDQDSPICTELDEQLDVLRRNRTIDTWNKNKILAGQDTSKEQKKHFEEADIILLFISPGFFSNQICIEQMSRALERAEAEGTLVIPTIIRACDWRHSPVAHLQPLPHNGNPISTSRFRDVKLLEVVNEIRTIIEQMFSISLPSLPPHSPSLGGSIVPLERVRGLAINSMGCEDARVSPPPRPPSSPSLGGFFTPLECVRGLTTNYVGREDALERLRTHFKNREKHLFIIGGLDGMGKTTLAAQFATEIDKEYNVLWINCGDVIVTYDTFLREIGRIASEQYKRYLLRIVLDNPTIHSDEKEDALLTFLAFISHLDHEENDYASLKPIVLFLDGYHKVGDPALNQLLLKIARRKVGAKMVLTLRQIPKDFRLASGLVTAITLSGFSVTSCRQLMELQAGSYPALRNLDDEMFSRVWARTQGVPAALELLISMTQNRTLEEVLEQLPGKDEDVFTELMRRHWYESLFNDLSEEERQVVIEASIFRRLMTPSALRAVSQCAETDEIIDKLINRFVLMFDRKQLSMNALLLDYAKSRLSSPKAQELHLRAAEFYFDYLSSNPTEELLSQQESCYHFIKADEKELAEVVLTEIAASLRDGGFFQEFFDILNQIEQSGRLIAPALLLEKAIMLYKQGEVNLAIALLKGLESTSDKQIEIKIRAQQELGWIFIETGKRKEARDYLQNSRRLAHSENQPILEAEALCRLQHIAYHQCHYEQALEYNEERIIILEKIQGNQKISNKIRKRIPEEIYWTKHETANVYRERGEYEKALQLYKEALAFWQEWGSPGEKVGWLCYDIGQIYRDEGKYQEAYRQFEMAFEIFHKMPHLYALAHTEIELGRVGFKVGKSEDAIKSIQKAIQTLDKIRGCSGIAYGRGALGQIYLWSGQLDKALEEFQKSKEKEEELGSIKGIAWTLHQMSLVYFEQGKQFLKTGNRIEACSRFQRAQRTIGEAQRFFISMGAIPNLRGIQDDAVRILERLADC